MNRRPRLSPLIGCCLLLGCGTIEAATPAIAASGTSSRTVPGQLTTKFPLGSQHLCCQSTSQSRTTGTTAGGAAGPGATSAGSKRARAAGAGATGAGATGTRATSGASGAGGMPAVIWIGLGTAVAGLLGAGVAGVSRSRREPAPNRSPAPRSLPAVGYATASPRSAVATHTGTAADEARYRRLDDTGDAGGAFNLGVLLHKRRDVPAAVAAYERAEQRGDPDAAFNLGVLLYETGDLAGAEAAWQRSVERGHPRAAANLIFVAHRHRATVPPELDRAADRRDADQGAGAVDELVFRRADERGGARGAFNLGVVLHERGDTAGALAAYQRAEQRGDPDAAFNLGVLLYEAGDLDGAEASWRRSAQRGNPRATENLAFLVRRRRERETAGAGRHGGNP